MNAIILTTVISAWLSIPVLAWDADRRHARRSDALNRAMDRGYKVRE